MITRSTALSIFIILFFTSDYAAGQDIHYTQFNATPLTLNPAYTGLFNGNLRASAIYHNQFDDANIPYTTFGLSVDKQIHTNAHSDFIAVGFQYIKDISGDGTLSNMSALVSIAGHMFFGKSDSLGNRKCLLSAGMQGGYIHYDYDVSGEFFNNHQAGPASQRTKPYIINTGASFSQSVTRRFCYTFGISANYLNQPSDPARMGYNRRLHLDLNYIFSYNATAQVTSRFSMRPAVFYQVYEAGNNLIAGNEFHFDVSNKHAPKKPIVALFFGAWYNTGDVYSINTGVEHNILRASIAYSYNLLPGIRTGGGFDISVKFIHPYASSSPYNRISTGKRF